MKQTRVVTKVDGNREIINNSSKKKEALLKWKRYLFKVTTQPGRRTVIGP